MHCGKPRHDSRKYKTCRGRRHKNSNRETSLNKDYHAWANSEDYILTDNTNKIYATVREIYDSKRAYSSGSVLIQTDNLDSYEDFKVEIEKGGFLMCHWDGTVETEELIKNETKATVRCIPLEGDKTPGECMVTGKPSSQRVIFARAY